MYLFYVYIVLYLIAHLPVPAMMLRHQEAVSDLLLGEEFDSETTHIYKSYYDVMTVEEMWQWAQGPMAAGLVVDGAPDGMMDALVGTNWLLGPIRIRQERSKVYSTEESCSKTLEGAFGDTMGKKLIDRGVQCTTDFRTKKADTWDMQPFLDLSQPLATLGICTDICAPANADQQTCEAAGACIYTAASTADDEATCAPVDSSISEKCAAWNGDPETCADPPGVETCAYTTRSWVEAFPEWVEDQRQGDCSTRDWVEGEPQERQDCSRAYCCSVAGCFDDKEQQLESIAGFGEDKEHACSLDAQTYNLTWNPQDAYKSTVKSDTTSSDNLWASRRNFGDGGYHIDLPGDGETLVPMLKALEELGFADHASRSIDFQLVLINANNFTAADHGLTMSTMSSDYSQVVVVAVELNFHFSPSGYLSKYDRIQAIQLKPFHFVFGTTSDSEDDETLLVVGFFLFPVVLILQELREFSDAGFAYFRSGWNMYEILYIGSVLAAISAINSYTAVEDNFLQHYNDSSTQDMYNDALPLRSRYKTMNKFIGLWVFITVSKTLKYAKIFRSTTVLTSTIDKAKAQLFSYFMVLLLIISSFALLCVMMWGYTSANFHNIPSALYALVRLASGEAELDYDDLKRGDASWTPLVFMGFVIFVALIGMNLMIAIITDCKRRPAPCVQFSALAASQISDTRRANPS